VNKLLFLSFLVLLQASALAQRAGDAAKFRSQLTAINNQLSAAFIKKDAAGILDLYGDSGVVCMPEYHTALYSKKTIGAYYQQLLQGITFSKYQRSIYQVQQLEDYLIEIGNYEAVFTKGEVPYSHKGKYLNVWKIKGDDQLALISEAWGTSTASDRSVLSFMKIPDTLPPAPDSSLPIVKEVNARNKFLSKLVADREGEKHATEIFTRDAIYLTYDTSMLIGMQQLKPYFTEHESPSVAIDSISIRASRMMPLKEYVIEYGYYFVNASWNDHKEHVTVMGKSTNIWKRKNGKLMMYRQMVNHD